MAITHPGGPILCVVGARPNFMKIAPVMRALSAAVPLLPARLLHTGQHYDQQMNSQYFQSLGIQDPDINLEVGSGSHAVQTAEIMRRFEPVLDREQPAAVLVVGDVNSTLACALVAAKKGVAVMHVEAGLRSFDRTMPEEINRVLTDQLSDLLFTTENSGQENLLREGIPGSSIHFVGNVMIDTLRYSLKRSVSAMTTFARHCVSEERVRAVFAVLTLHRASNVDDPVTLRGLLETVIDISRRIPVVFPVHPRTRSRIEQEGLAGILKTPALITLPPLDYLEMLGLMQEAKMVLTDSGGIQEETTALGIPCITLRENTERPITADEGTNTIVGLDRVRILAAVDDVLRTGGKAGRIPDLWDGQASQRIVSVIQDWITNKGK